MSNAKNRENITKTASLLAATGHPDQAQVLLSLLAAKEDDKEKNHYIVYQTGPS